MKAGIIGAALLAGMLHASGTEYRFQTAEECTYETPRQKVQESGGVFTHRGMVHFWTKKLFHPEPGKKYAVTAEIRTDSRERLPGVCIAVVYFNDAGKFIWTREYMTVPGTFTALARPTAMDDTVLSLKAPGGWKPEGGRAYVVAFEAKADESDLPNPKVSTRIKSIVREGDILKITLTKPLFAEFPAGTPVRLHYDFSFYQPCPEGQFYNFPAAAWKQCGGSFKVPAGMKQFRPAVIYYDPVKSTKKSFEMRNFKLVEEESLK